MQTGDTNYICKNELDKACFQRDAAYSDSKDLVKRTQLDKVLFLSKFKKIKGYSSFRDNVWGVDLTDMQLISKYNKRNRYLLCAINLFSKYTFVVPLNDKKGVTIANAFQSILDKSKRKPNKIWVGQGS